MYIRKWMLAGIAGLMLAGCQQTAGSDESSTLSALPSPELESGIRGEQFGIDKNINEATIDQYLFRDDTVYRDMRMLKDEANYEAIGGDAWLSGIVEGFEVVPYPYLVNVEGLPEEVGSTYSGVTLFTHDENGYTANYEESMDILEYLFPKDKNIILMCGGGGYAGMTKAMLAELGWDENRLYNAGGYWYYEGDHKIELKREANGTTYYDFYKLNYHYLDFDSLHRITESSSSADTSSTGTEESSLSEGFTSLTVNELEDKIAAKDTFVLFVYRPGCTACAGFAPIARAAEETAHAQFYAISLAEEGADTSILKETVKYTPSMLVFKNGEITGMLDASSDEDIVRFEDASELLEWIRSLIDIEECTTACPAFGPLN